MEKFDVRRLVGVIATLLFAAWITSLGIHSKTGVSHFDQSVWQFFVDHGSSQTHSMARFVTSFGVVGVLLPVAAVCGVLVWAKSRSIAVAFSPWVSVIVCSEIVSALKKTTGIVRPPLQFQVTQIDNPSFPSGHGADTTALIVSVVLVVWCVADVSRRTKMWASIGGAVACIAMGLTRLVLNVHWLSDVFAGCFIGAAVGLSVTGLLIIVRRLNFDA